ncbi:hypothetical protein CJ483_03165 [Bacillus sp. PK3_68]|nr:hypothetical protein CJ483_03165 [Bacillus sp. PK3_68]
MLDKYIKLIESFLKNEIGVAEFEKKYFKTFLNDPDEKELDEESFTILNDLFESVDCYWHECKPGEETDFEISEEQLRVDTQKALQGLYFLKRS